MEVISQSTTPDTARTKSFMAMLKNIYQREAFFPLLFTLAGLLIWVVSLPGIDLSQLNDLGLISVMTPGSFIALILITLGFAWVIRQAKPSTPLAVLQLVVLLFMQHGITAIIEPLARFGPAWRHVGVVDYIMRNGSVNPRIDAYFNWPGFFGLGALLTQAAGLSDASPFLQWTPMLNQLLYMGALWVIYSNLTEDRRLIWGALWVFTLSNWVGQDYFSPQGLNFFYYLVVVGILLRAFKTGGLERTPPFLNWFLQKVQWVRNIVERLLVSEVLYGKIATSTQRVLLILIVIIIYAASVPSHQLTPFAILFAVVALVSINRISTRSLPILMLVLLGAWISYMTVAYMSSRIEALLSEAGKMDELLGANLVSRMKGSPDHQLVVRMRMALAGGLWLVAFFGGLRRWRAGFTDTSVMVLAATPFLLIGLQDYGGEMLLRVFLFSLPFTVFFAASLFFPKPVVKPGWRSIVAFSLASAVMTLGFFFVRYGNERMESFTVAEKEAIEYVYATVPEGSLLASVTSHMPYKYMNYEKYKYALFEDAILTDDFDTILDKMNDPKYKAAYLIITRAQKAQLQIFYSFSSESLDRFLHGLFTRDRFQLIFSNEGADVYELIREDPTP